MIAMNAAGTFPYTPASGLLYGLAETIDMLHEEGLDNVFARHERLAEAVRRAVRAWGLDIWCHDPKAYSPAVTAVGMPEGHNADAFRKIVLDNFDMSLGTGLNKLAGKAFRIGHLGHTNELTICGALCGVEMGWSWPAFPTRRAALPRRWPTSPRRRGPRRQRLPDRGPLSVSAREARGSELDLALLAELEEFRGDAALDLGDRRRRPEAQAAHVALAGRAQLRRHLRRKLQLLGLCDEACRHERQHHDSSQTIHYSSPSAYSS